MIASQNYSEIQPLQPTEIDWAVNVMKDVFKTNLAWLTHAYGRAYKHKPNPEDEKLMPYVYIGNIDGRYSLTDVRPDNDKAATLFFSIGRERPLNYDQNFDGYMAWDLGIIFWLNLELINKELSNTEDYTQLLIKEVRKVIRDNFLGLGFRFDMAEITRDFNEVFREFNLKDKKAGILPYSCFRINATVTLKEGCGVQDGGGGTDPGSDAPIVLNAPFGNFFMTGNEFSLQIEVDHPERVTRYYVQQLPDYLTVDETTGLVTGTLPDNAEAVTMRLSIEYDGGITGGNYYLQIVDYDINLLQPPYDLSVTSYNTIGISFMLDYYVKHYAPGYERLEFFINGTLYRTFVNGSPYNINGAGHQADLMQKVPPFPVMTPFEFTARYRDYNGNYSDFSETLIVTIPNP